MKIAKWKLIVSSAFVVLPGAVAVLTGGGWGSMLVSTLLLAGHLFCLLFTAKDPGNREQSNKVFDLLLWIFPVLSAMLMVVPRALEAGMDMNPALLLNLLMGSLALAIGNYLPKTRRNSTIGIKIKWTLENDENWNATHRFGGKVWTAAGVGFLVAVLLPEGISMVIAFMLIAVMVVLPTVYSYRFYRRQLAQGSYVKSEMSLKGISKKWAIAGSAAVLVVAAVLMFTGNTHFTLGEDALGVSATYWNTTAISYEDIDEVIYAESYDGGYRSFGFASARLCLGSFRSEELGNYVRYTYVGVKPAVIVKAGRNTYALSDRTASQTQALYNALREAAERK